MRHCVTVLIIAICISQNVRSTSANVIYSNNFEINTDGFSTTSTTVIPNDGSGFSNPVNTSTFLGQFAGNDSTTLSLSGLTAGMTYNVAFDLFIGRTMDGNTVYSGFPQFGPDGWSLTTNALQPTLIDTTFLNVVIGDGTPGTLAGYSQSYSDNNPVGPGNFAAFTGADIRRDDLSVPPNNSDFLDRYSLYFFGHGAGNPVIQFTATGSTADLVFAGFNMQSSNDEFWALDNVTVSSNAVPEPTSLALLLIGSIGSAFGSYRCRRSFT